MHRNITRHSRCRYELRVVGAYKHFQAKTSETDVTRTFNVHWSQWRNQDFISEGLELWERASRYYLPAPVSPEIQQKLKTFSNVRDFKCSCLAVFTSTTSVGAHSVR